MDDSENNFNIKAMNDYLDVEQIPDEEKVDLICLLDNLLESELIFMNYAYSDNLKRFLIELDNFSKERNEPELRPRLELSEKPNLRKLCKKEIYILVKDLQDRGQLNPNAPFFGKRRYSSLNLWPMSYIVANKQKEEQFNNVRNWSKGREDISNLVLAKYERVTPYANASVASSNQPKTLPPSGAPDNAMEVDTEKMGFSTPKKSNRTAFTQQLSYTDNKANHKTKPHRPSRIRHRSSSPLDRNNITSNPLFNSVKRNIFKDSGPKIYADGTSMGGKSNNEIVQAVQRGMEMDMDVSEVKITNPGRETSKNMLKKRADSGMLESDDMGDDTVENLAMPSCSKKRKTDTDHLQGGDFSAIFLRVDNLECKFDCNLNRIETLTVKNSQVIESTNTKMNKLFTEVETMSVETIPNMANRIDALENREERPSGPIRPVVPSMEELELGKAKYVQAGRAYAKFIEKTLETGQIFVNFCTTELIFNVEENFERRKPEINKIGIEKLLGFRFKEVELWINNRTKKFEGILVADYECPSDRKRAVRRALELRKRKALQRILGISIHYDYDSEYCVDLTLNVWRRNGIITDHGINGVGHIYLKFTNPKNSQPSAQGSSTEQNKTKILYPCCPVMLSNLEEKEINPVNLNNLINKNRFIIYDNKVVELPEEIRRSGENLEHILNNTPNDDEDMAVVDMTDGVNQTLGNQPLRSNFKSNNGWNSNNKGWANNKSKKVSFQPSKVRYFNTDLPEVNQSYNQNNSSRRNYQRDNAEEIINRNFGHRHRNSRSSTRNFDAGRTPFNRNEDDKREDVRDRARTAKSRHGYRTGSARDAAGEDRHREGKSRTNRNEADRTNYFRAMDKELGLDQSSSALNSNILATTNHGNGFTSTVYGNRNSERTVNRCQPFFASEDIREKERKDSERVDRKRYGR